MTRRCSFTSHSCMPLVTAPATRQEVGHLLALEPDALGVGGHEDVERLQAGVLDLVLQVGGDLHQGFVDGGVLQAGDLDPRVHLLDVRASRLHGVCRTRNASTPFWRMPDFCGSSCVTPSRVTDLQAHALLGHQQERALLFAGLAQDQLRDRPGVGGLDAGPGQADGELLLAFGLAAQVQRDHAAGVALQLGPMAQAPSR